MTIGIYRIRNTINNKSYIGKSRNIERRFEDHLRTMRKGQIRRGVNRYLIHASNKYGIESFAFEILQEFQEVNEATLADAEVYWMDTLKTLDRDFGYNLMRDSSSSTRMTKEARQAMSDAQSGEKNGNYGHKWTEEQKARMSEIKKQQFTDGTYDFMHTPEHRAYLSACSKEIWKNTEKKAGMARKVAEVTSTLRFEQYDKKTGVLVGTYESMLEIADKYPDFNKIAIYSVCNGWKKSYRGFIWKSFEKCAIIQ
jgi:group I intron endonuclease